MNGTPWRLEPTAEERVLARAVVAIALGAACFRIASGVLAHL